MGVLSSLYGTSLSLLTDLYQLTMAYGYYKNGMKNREAVFHLFFRKNPFGGRFAVAAGLEYAVDFIRNFRFAPDDLDYLAGLCGNDGKPLFDPDFLRYLETYRLCCDVDAIPEGTPVLPHQPLLRIKGPLIDGQLLETPLLNIINFQTLIATKAARVCQATQGDAVLEFGLRRAQGIDGSLAASRAAFIGGCSATSNVLAGKLLGIPVKGTHAHSWVMSFDTEREAFEKYAQAMPNNCVFLVDTYDTLEGVKNAIEIGRRLKAQGYQMAGVRLDSGDMADLSIKARQLLDEAGMPHALIVASNDLDEHSIAQLKQQGAKIAVWGVGTNMVTAYDQPALGGVYKLGAIKANNDQQWQYRIKLSETPIKTSNPGILQVKRTLSANGQVCDMIFNELQPYEGVTLKGFDGNTYTLPTAKGAQVSYLLQPIFRNGEQTYSLPKLADIRAYAVRQLATSSFENAQNGLAENLYELKRNLIKQHQVIAL